MLVRKTCIGQSYVGLFESTLQGFEVSEYLGDKDVVAQFPDALGVGEQTKMCKIVA